MINWIKDKLGITALEKENKYLQDKLEQYDKLSTNNSTMINRLREEFAKNNRLSSDLSMRDRSFVILSGNWRGKDYVEIFEVVPEQFNDLRKELSHSNREIKVDAPMYFDWIH